MSQEIVLVEEILAYSAEENPWLQLYFDKVRFPDGRVGRYNRVVESNGRPGVAVLPITNPSAVGLVRQFRYPTGGTVWEIPRGFGQHSDARVDAVRELKEETGITVTKKQLVDLGGVHPNSGILASSVSLFLALCTDIEDKVVEDTHEIAEFRWFSVNEVTTMIDKGEINDCFTISACFRARHRQYI